MDINKNKEVLEELCENYGFKYNQRGFVSKSENGYTYKVLLIGSVVRTKDKKDIITDWNSIDDVLKFIK